MPTASAAITDTPTDVTSALGLVDGEISWLHFQGGGRHAYIRVQLGTDGAPVRGDSSFQGICVGNHGQPLALGHESGMKLWAWCEPGHAGVVIATPYT